tara:strand:+ start:180 stop:359 length:180 start_codon:yes stop_codon:yes gene_type:complete
VEHKEVQTVVIQYFQLLHHLVAVLLDNVGLVRQLRLVSLEDQVVAVEQVALVETVTHLL